MLCLMILIIAFIGLKVYKTIKKIFLVERKIDVCQLNWLAVCCFQPNIGDIDL